MTDWKQKATEAWEQPGWDEARREYHARKQTPQSKSGDWPEPKPLPTGLVPVEPYRSEFMPAALAPWVDDIAKSAMPARLRGGRGHCRSRFRHRPSHRHQAAGENRLGRSAEPVGVLHRPPGHVEVARR